MPRIYPAYTGEPPVSQRNPKAAYWSTLLDHDTALYFQYNQCKDDPQRSFAVFRAELSQLMARNTVQRVVLDLRYNGGGSNQVLAPWVKEIRASRFNRKGKLFILIGPHTFSSAVYHAVELRDTTAAILLGEPTCGKPNEYGDVRTMDLPNSRIKVAYSTKYFRQRPVDEPCLMPDALIEQTSTDFFSGIDPVIGAALR
jgi:C-terminal processing protease CtpA/Prc